MDDDDCDDDGAPTPTAESCKTACGDRSNVNYDSENEVRVATEYEGATGSDDQLPLGDVHSHATEEKDRPRKTVTWGNLARACTPWWTRKRR